MSYAKEFENAQIGPWVHENLREDMHPCGRYNGGVQDVIMDPHIDQPSYHVFGSNTHDHYQSLSGVQGYRPAHHMLRVHQANAAFDERAWRGAKQQDQVHPRLPHWPPTTQQWVYGQSDKDDRIEYIGFPTQGDGTVLAKFDQPFAERPYPHQDFQHAQSREPAWRC